MEDAALLQPSTCFSRAPQASRGGWEPLQPPAVGHSHFTSNIDLIHFGKKEEIMNICPSKIIPIHSPHYSHLTFLKHKSHRVTLMNSHPELPMPLRIRLQVCSMVNMDLQLISAALTLPISLLSSPLQLLLCSCPHSSVP